MTIQKVLPCKKFNTVEEWKDESTYDTMKKIESSDFSFYLGEIRLLDSANSFHSVIGVSSIDDYEKYDLLPLKDVLHDYVMNLFYLALYDCEGMRELNNQFKAMLDYFGIPTDKESYKETVSNVTGALYYSHIESGIQL